MNTPRTKRRHNYQPDWKNRKGGTYAAGLTNPDYALALAAIVSEFEHLELNMAPVLAMLLGSTDDLSAGYVLRALSSPKSRIEVMTALLEKAPINKNTGEEYDDILREYDEIRASRNGYVHGIWHTCIDTGAVEWARRAEHGYWFFDADEEPLENLTALVMRIRKLNIRVVTEIRSQLIWREKKQRQIVHLPLSQEPKPLKTAPRSRRPRNAAKSPPQPPSPSPAKPRKTPTKKAKTTKRQPV